MPKPRLDPLLAFEFAIDSTFQDGKTKERKGEALLHIGRTGSNVVTLNLGPGRGGTV